MTYTAVTFAPVQSFIHSSRKLRDLYGSSLLLSHLGHAISADATRRLGPDVVVSPADASLSRGVPNTLVFRGDYSLSQARAALLAAWSKVLEGCRQWLEATIQVAAFSSTPGNWEEAWGASWKAAARHSWEVFQGQGATITAARLAMTVNKRQRDWSLPNWTGESSSLSSAEAVVRPTMACVIQPWLLDADAAKQEARAMLHQLRDKLGDAFAGEDEEISLLELVKRLITYRPILKAAFQLTGEQPLQEATVDGLLQNFPRLTTRSRSGERPDGENDQPESIIWFMATTKPCPIPMGLEGQGPAAKLLNDSAEFRPTMFRAAIRGMALRLFGGLTDSEAALRIVGKLFGSLGKEQSQNVGLLATAYTDAVTSLGSYGRGSWVQPIYATSGVLQWRLTHSPGPDTTTALLADLLAALHGLTMSLAGFGRGWRRPDHRIFYHHRYDKTPIGCHWQWREPQDLPAWIHVQSPRDLARLLQRARQLASQWLDLNQVRHGEPAPWREVMHPQCMRVWIRQASGPDDAVAVAWFHHSPAEGEHSSDPADPRDLKRTRLAGQMNQVGLIWNRLLPLMEKRQTSKSAAAARPASPMARPTAAALARPGSPRQQQAQPPRPRDVVCIPAHQGAYLESLVLHSLPGNAQPEESLHYQRFIDEMNRGAGADFEALDWS